MSNEIQHPSQDFTQDQVPALHYDVKETTDVVRFLASLANATDASLADGKINAFDIANFISTIPLVSAAVNGIAVVPKELNDLDAVERHEINIVLQNTLRLRNPVTDALAKSALDAGLHFAQLVSEIRAARQKELV